MATREQAWTEWAIECPALQSPLDFVVGGVADVASAPPNPGHCGGADVMQSEAGPGDGYCHPVGTGSLATPEQVDVAIRHLRECLAACRGKSDEKRRSALLEAWTAVQSDLGVSEIRELRPAFLNALFPGKIAPAPSRGRLPQQGGYSQCP